MQNTKSGGFSGQVEFTGTRVVLLVEEKPRHGENQLGSAYEIAIGAAIRRHHTEHRGGPAIVTSHNRWYFVSNFVGETEQLLMWSAFEVPLLAYSVVEVVCIMLPCTHLRHIFFCWNICRLSSKARRVRVSGRRWSFTLWCQRNCSGRIWDFGCVMMISLTMRERWRFFTRFIILILLSINLVKSFRTIVICRQCVAMIWEVVCKDFSS